MKSKYTLLDLMFASVYHFLISRVITERYIHYLFNHFFFLFLFIYFLCEITPCFYNWLLRSHGCAGCGGSVMDVQLLSRIDDELDSSEVAELCFLCLDAVSRKSLEGVSAAHIGHVNMPEK